MNKRHLDFLLTVLIPLVLGILVYVFPFNTFLRNYLPDGLWAYAFVSVVLIIWERKINYFWLGICYMSVVLFEALQYLNYVKGTADLYDLLVYTVFIILALLTNSYIKLKHTHIND